VFLLRRIGEGRARELLLTGEWIKAEKALEIGLVNKIVKPAELDKVVRNFALSLCENNSGQSMALTKKMIAEIQSMDLLEATDYAARMNAQARDTADCKRGIASFLNREDLKW